MWLMPVSECNIMFQRFKNKKKNKAGDTLWKTITISQILIPCFSLAFSKMPRLCQCNIP